MSQPPGYRGIDKARERYKKWWVGRLCRLAGQANHKFKRVVDVEVIGPPSFVYGIASLVFEDGSTCNINQGESFKPRKCDVEIMRSATESSIGDIYTFRDSQALISFLRKNEFLIPLLVEANEKVKKHFQESRLFLELTSDPEGVDPDQLVLYISTDLPPKEARPKLKALDREWWLDVLSRAQGKLCISLEYQ